MKSWNKPIRFSTKEEMKSLKNYDEQFNKNSRNYGITNWMVGTCTYPWSPWLQIHIGYWSIQIKWYVIVGLLLVSGFIVGSIIN